MRKRLLAASLLCLATTVSQAGIIYDYAVRGLYSWSGTTIRETTNSGVWNDYYGYSDDYIYSQCEIESDLNSNWIVSEMRDVAAGSHGLEPSRLKSQTALQFQVTQTQDFLLTAAGHFRFYEDNGAGTGFDFEDEYLSLHPITLISGRQYVLLGSASATPPGWGYTSSSTSFRMVPVPEPGAALVLVIGLTALRTRRIKAK